MSSGSTSLKPLIRILVVSLLAIVLLALLAWVFVTQPFVRAGVDHVGSAADPHRLRAHVRFLTELEPQRDVDHPEQLRRGADYVRAEFDGSGLAVEEQTYEARAFRGRTFVNVMGRLGSSADKPRIVVGAHYDVYGDSGRNPGADDNASGVAGLLELARILGAEGVAERLPVRVEFVAYSTEEPPFFATPDMGSAVHARSLTDRASNDVVAMICLEMIGYYTPRQARSSLLVSTFYPRRGDFALVIGRGFDRQDRTLAAWLRRGLAARNEIRTRSYVGPYILGVDLSDHRNYWAEGVPAVMVSDTAFLRNPNYHTEDDTADTLDYPKMSYIVNGLANALLSGVPGG